LLFIKTFWKNFTFEFEKTQVESCFIDGWLVSKLINFLI